LSGERHNRLDEFLARPERAVWTVSAPMMAGMLLAVAFTIVETAFVGRLGGAALAALTIVFPLLFVIIAIVNGIGTGIAALVAQALGRRDLAEAERIGGTAIAFGVIVGLAVAAAGVAGGPFVLRHLGGTATVTALACQYFFVLALAAPFIFVGAFLRFLLTGEGDSRTPTIVQLAVVIVQVGLDWLFIFPLRLGVRGAALGTVCANFGMSVVLLYLVLWRRRNVVKLHWRSLVPSWGAVRAVLAVGVPNSISQLLIAFGAMALNRAVASFGDGALAAFGVGARIDQVAVMPIIGLASGSITVIGMFAGAGRVDLVRRMSWYSIRWAVLIATGVAVAVYLGSVPVMRLFTPDAETIAVGRHYLMFMIFVYPFMAIGLTGSRILLGLSYPNLSLAVVAVRLVLFAIPIAYVSVYVFGAPIDGVWWGLLVGSVGSATAASLLLRRMVWQRDPTARATQSATELETAAL
jgi:putative MATE family efflux protein